MTARRPREGRRSGSTADVGLPRLSARSARFDLVGSLPENARTEFDRRATSRRYAAGQTIYQKEDIGTEMFRIITGEVQLTFLLEDGRQLFHTLYQSGDCFGITSLVDHGPRPQFAEAYVNTKLQVLQQRDFDALRSEYSAFDQAMILLLTNDVRSLIKRVNSARLELVPSRVARCILRFARRDPGGDLVARLSQSEIATMVDASRQRVNKTLQTLQARHLIKIGYGTIHIRNRDALLRQTEST